MATMPALAQPGSSTGAWVVTAGPAWPRAKSPVGSAVAAVAAAAVAINWRRVNDEPHFMDQAPYLRPRFPATWPSPTSLVQPSAKKTHEPRQRRQPQQEIGGTQQYTPLNGEVISYPCAGTNGGRSDGQHCPGPRQVPDKRAIRATIYYAEHADESRSALRHGNDFVDVQADRCCSGE